MPLNFALIDEELDGGIKAAGAKLLCVTGLVPEGHRVGAKHGVTVVVETDSLV